MLTGTNTTGVDFVFNNLQAALQSGSNTNADSALPLVMALDPQSALAITGRQPGGPSYLKSTNVATPSSTTGAMLLDGFETRASKLPYAKNGAFIVSLNGTNSVTVQLTNTAINTNGQAGDTVFATWNQIVLYNLSGVDGNNAASLTVAPAASNGANLQFTASNTTGLAMTIDGASAQLLGSVNGVTVNSTKTGITITPTADSLFGCVVSGA